MKQGEPQASLRASEAAKRLEPRGHGAKRSPQGRNTAQALAQGGAKVWDDHAELRAGAKMQDDHCELWIVYSPATLIVDKPLVCQRGLPGRLQIKDLRPATGTGMHFYRKCKHLLCKKCQK